MEISASTVDIFTYAFAHVLGHLPPRMYPRAVTLDECVPERTYAHKHNSRVHPRKGAMRALTTIHACTQNTNSDFTFDSVKNAWTDSTAETGLEIGEGAKVLFEVVRCVHVVLSRTSRAPNRVHMIEKRTKRSFVPTK